MTIKAMVSWVMSRMMSDLVAVLAGAGFGKSETGAGDLAIPREHKINSLEWAGIWQSPASIR